MVPPRRQTLSDARSPLLRPCVALCHHGRVPSQYTPHRFVRPSGYLLGRTIAYPAVAQSREAVAYYQRILQGLGIDVGPQRADGYLGDATVRGVRLFQGWYNGERASERGPSLTVDGILGPATQSALQRYASRASSTVVAQAPVNVTPVAPQPRPASTVPVTGVSPSPGWGDPNPWTRTSDVGNVASFMDPTINLGSNTAQTPTSGWTIVATLCGVTAAVIALARYNDDRKTR